MVKSSIGELYLLQKLTGATVVGVQLDLVSWGGHGDETLGKGMLIGSCEMRCGAAMKQHRGGIGPSECTMMR